jgi:uncharacterized protein YbaR (Trm112 family)
MAISEFANIFILSKRCIFMRILICPVCKSPEIDLDAGGYTGKYHCRKCGYIGSLIVEVDEREFKSKEWEE